MQRQMLRLQIWGESKMWKMRAFHKVRPLRGLCLKDRSLKNLHSGSCKNFKKYCIPLSSGKSNFFPEILKELKSSANAALMFKFIPHVCMYRNDRFLIEFWNELNIHYKLSHTKGIPNKTKQNKDKFAIKIICHKYK